MPGAPAKSLSIKRLSVFSKVRTATYKVPILAEVDTCVDALVDTLPGWKDDPMSINLLCHRCKKTHKLGTSKCSCGAGLKYKRKYRVRVKTAKGWKSGTVDTLQEAKTLEGQLIQDNPPPPRL